MGGSDQWGNIINGVELVRKILRKESFGLTTPLLTLSSGAKMGKTEKGAIWLDKKLFSPYDYWQFWRNTSDQDVKKFLKYFTEINLQNLSEKIDKETNINKLKILLANETTSLLHGPKLAKECAETATETFVKGGIGKNVPENKVSKSEVKKGINIIDLVYQNGLVQSKSDARRIMKNNGLKINDKVIIDEKKIINLDDFLDKNYIKLSIGKKNHLKITVV